MDKVELNKLLKQKKIVSPSVLDELENDPGASKAASWEDFLLEKKVATEDQLLELESESLHIPVVDLRSEHIQQDILALVPEPIAHRHKVISFAKTKNDLSLAMTDPTDIQTKDFIKKKTGLLALKLKETIFI